MLLISKLFIALCAITFIICLYVINSHSHIYALWAFFISVLLMYIYAYSMHNTWVGLILILWYAGGVSVLFYLIADATSSSYYNSKVFSNLISSDSTGHIKKKLIKSKVVLKSLDSYRLKFNNFSKNYTTITTPILNLKMNLKTVLNNDIFRMSTSLIYFVLLNMLAIFKYLTPRLWDLFIQNVVNKFIIAVKSCLINMFDLVKGFIKEFLTAYYGYFRDTISWWSSTEKNTTEGDDIFTINTSTDIPELWMWLDDYQYYFIDEKDFVNYTDFTQIYNSLVSTPSSIFLVFYLLPLFLYLIYVICKYLSHRR